MNLLDGSLFQCVDCHVWLEQDSAQVVFGKQLIEPDVIGRVGRCQHCGQGLPAITYHAPFEFTKNDRPFKLTLAWDMTRAVFTYVALKGPVWKPVDAFDLNQLRSVLASIIEPNGISLEEVESLKHELYDSSDADLWSRLVKS